MIDQRDSENQHSRQSDNAAIAQAVAAAVEIVKRDYRLDDLMRRVEHIEAGLIKMQETLDKIETAANRWKGGFLVVVSLGAILGWLVSVGSGIGKLFRP